MIKRLFFVLFLLVSINICTYGLTFMGAALGSSPTSFTNILKSKGCYYVTTNYGSPGYTEYYKGKYWQFTNATIALCVAHNRVESVHVEWEYTSSATQLIAELDKKYGRHTSKDNYDPVLGYVGQVCTWYVSDGYVQLFWDKSIGLIVSYYLGNPNSDL